MIDRSLRYLLLGLLAVLVPVAAPAQVRGLPVVNTVLGRVDGVVADTLHTTSAIGQTVTGLATARIDRVDQFVHDHRASVERDDTGQPARAHEVLVLDPDPDGLRLATGAGFALVEQGDAGGLGVAYARLQTPPGKSLAGAIRALRRMLPGRTITADTIHFPAGTGAAQATGTGAIPAPRDAAVGVIDGGVPAGPRIVAQAGFAAGAPHADAHAQAIASLLAGAGIARIMVADVYGTDPAGGSALAIVRALGWMQAHGLRVVSISLVGPANPLLAHAVAVVQARGMLVVAAVGNDGAAAPPAYPASYPGVIAVTAVDGHNHVLFEAGHALHLDYAAPGADLTAVGLDGREQRLRGTSFAAPLVAARLAALASVADTRTVLQRADQEATAPGPRTGRGILCATCRKGI
jgi:subtilisin family serine protease